MIKPSQPLMKKPELQAECVWPLGAELGEGPLWLAEQGRLFFTDILGRQLHAFRLATGERQSWPLPERLCWLVARRDGDGLMAGFADGIARLWLGEQLRIEYLLHPFADQSGVRLNDAKADAHGAIWFGSMHERDYRRAEGSLCRLAPDGSWQRASAGYHICNGPVAGLDGQLLYHNDSYLGRTYAYRLDRQGRLGPRQVWRQFDAPREGGPDGMTIDADGCLWIAQWGGGRVCRYSPVGELLATIRLPLSQPSSLCFGGDGLRTLFITTAWETLGPEQRAAQPLAGGLFAIQPGVAGLPAQRYG